MFVQFSQNLLGVIWWSLHWLLKFITLITTQTKTRSSWHCFEAVTYLENQSITTCLQIWAALSERAHWGSIKSKSCRFQYADSLPLLFVHLSNLVREELIMWTLHLPFLLLILRGWVVVQGVDDVNLPPALCTPRPAKTVWFKSTVLVGQNFHICLLRSWRFIWRLP